MFLHTLLNVHRVAYTHTCIRTLSNTNKLKQTHAHIHKKTLRYTYKVILTHRLGGLHRHINRHKTHICEYTYTYYQKIAKTHGISKIISIKRIKQLN